MNVRTLCGRVALVAAMCALVGISPPAYAIVEGLEDTSEFNNPSSDWYGMSLDGIGKVGDGSAVAIGNRWFLTARHFSVGVGAEIELPDGSLHTVTDGYNAPIPSGQTYAPDLRIVRVAEEMDYWRDLYSGSFASNAPAIMAGTGYSGTVDPVHDTFMWNTGTGREWRWGTNSIDGTQLMQVSTGSGTFRSTCLKMGFNDTRTDYEAGFGNGDSGGGTFVYQDGQWNLAGINAYIDLLGAPTPPPYDVSYAVSVPVSAGWIRTIVPDGDLDDSGAVDATDIDLLYDYIDSFGGSGPVPPAEALSDLDSDKTVDRGDVSFLIRKILDTEYGDFNLDLQIDTTDLAILAGNFGLLGKGYGDGDANGDGQIDTTDLAILAMYYGFDAMGGDVVPEPTSIALMGAAVLGELRRRRRA